MKPFKENSELAVGKSEQEVNLLEGEESFVGAPANLPPVPQIAPSELYDSDDIGTLTNESPRFRDQGRGTVIDNETRLIWLKNANCAGSTNPDDGKTTWDNACKWVEELKECGTMNGQPSGDTSYRGSHQRDWRLPNIEELNSLIDDRFENPALSNADGDEQWKEGDPFINVQSDNYWSSSTDEGNTSYGWSADLNIGFEGDYCESDDFYVWPVRGKQKDHDVSGRI